MEAVKIKISIIVPAYNEEKRITRGIKHILDYIKKEKMNAEIIVVDDGSKDGTIRQAKTIKDKRLKVIGYKPNQGKGYAVKTGVKHAVGDIILFIDADLSIPIEEVKRFLPFLLNKNYSVVIASKGKRSSHQIKQKWYRVILGRGFNLLVRSITGLKFIDTQCGFKMFTKNAANKIFSKVKVKRFGFDVEVLYLAKKFRYKVKELPISLIDTPRSRVSIISDTYSMFKDILLIRWRDLNGRYR